MAYDFWMHIIKHFFNVCTFLCTHLYMSANLYKYKCQFVTFIWGFFGLLVLLPFLGPFHGCCGIFTNFHTMCQSLDDHGIFLDGLCKKFI
jgi:hypothetical protein